MHRPKIFVSFPEIIQVVNVVHNLLLVWLVEAGYAVVIIVGDGKATERVLAVAQGILSGIKYASN